MHLTYRPCLIYRRSVIDFLSGLLSRSQTEICLIVEALGLDRTGFESQICHIQAVSLLEFLNLPQSCEDSIR